MTDFYRDRGFSSQRDTLLRTSAPVPTYLTDLSQAGDLDNLNTINPERFVGAISWRDLTIPAGTTLSVNGQEVPVTVYGEQIYGGNGDTVTWHREKAAELVFPLAGNGIMRIKSPIPSQHEVEEIYYEMQGPLNDPTRLAEVEIKIEGDWLYGRYKDTEIVFRVKGILTLPGQSHMTEAQGTFVCIVQKTDELIA